MAYRPQGRRQARGYLEMAAGDLHQAIGLFFEMGGAPSAARTEPAAPAAGGYNEDVAAEVRAAAVAAGIDAGAGDEAVYMEEELELEM